MDKTQVQLLEQWRKEAEACVETLRDSSTHNSWSYYDLIGAYIDGCKATHEKMQKEIERRNVLIESLYRDLNLDVIDQFGITMLGEIWEQYKHDHNL